MIMEPNLAYNTVQENSSSAEPMYELVDVGANIEPVRNKTTMSVKQRSKVGKKASCVAIAVVTTIAVLALALALVAVVITIILKREINIRMEQLNFELSQNRYGIANLTEQVQNILISLQEQGDMVLPGNVSNVVSSCKEIPCDQPSGFYWIQGNSSNCPVQVYCDTGIRSCSCNATGPWMRVANLDMTDPSQQCPGGFRQINRTAAPLRTCGRPGPGCVSTTYPTHGIEYSRVCGRVIGYQFASSDAFLPYFFTRGSIDSVYVDGVSLTHGQSTRQHIWTFANALDETRASRVVCPCTKPELSYEGVVPPFIGEDYFCETGSRLSHEPIFYSEDPLWDGQGCEGTSTCCSFNNPPWFCKQLPEPTTDDIELRVCSDQLPNQEDTPLEIIEMYVQ